MGRPRFAKHPKPIEPEDESQEESTEPETHGAGDVSPSKAEAVRIALAEGIELPGDIAEFVLKKFGHEMSKQTVSSYKAQEKARQAKKAAAAAAPRRGRPPQSESASRPAAPKAANGELIDDIVAVKQLVEKMGAGQVRKLIDLFG